MKATFLSLATLAAGAAAQAPAYGQCGGSTWTGPTTCVSGWTCVYSNNFYSQCLQVAAASSTTTTVRSSTTTARTSTTTARTSTATARTSTTTVRTSTTTLVSTTTRVVTTSTTSPVVSSSTTTVRTSTTSAGGSTATGVYAEKCPFGYCTLNGGTTGGIGGPITVVTDLPGLTAAVAGDSPKIVVVSGTITGNVAVLIGSNTSILGRNANLVGVGLRVLDAHNVIIRNMKIGKCLAPIDSIGVQGPTTKNIWIDHCELYADQDHDKDYYDGLLDITHAVDYATVSNVYLHDHFKGSLVGHSDSNCPEDSGHLLVTYAYNRWDTIYSRGPMVRCGQVHVFNNYYNNLGDAIRTRAGAQMLVENSVWELTNDCIIAKDGYAVARGNDYGVGTNEAPAGTFTTAPYTYNLLATTSVKAYALANAGAILTGI